jgi:uncharacterized membrane protein YoaK (UPF0700 family)
MEILNTITNNFFILSNATIDWSPTAGPIWLLGMTIIMAVYGVFAFAHISRQEAAERRKETYLAAQKVAARRLERKEALGYMEYRNF